MKWRPIESAPNKGKIMVIGGMVNGEVFTYYKCNLPVVVKVLKGEYRVCTYCYYQIKIENPTHWMPIPEFKI